MTEPNRNLNEVPALITERKRYESWLEALDARRETTPVHVFERVQADYRTRLRRVAEQIASYRQAIEDEHTNVDSRLSLLEAEERMHRDERAELELRAHVGELSGEESVSAFSAVDEAVAKLMSEKEALQARIGELDALLEVPDLPSEPEAPVPPTPEPEAPPARTSSSQRAQGDEAPRSRVSVETSAALEEEAPAAQELAASAPEPEKAGEEAVPGPAMAEASSSAAEPSEPSEAPQTEPASIPRVSELRTPSGTFDELKFLNTVVGRGSATAPAPARDGFAPKGSATGEPAAGARPDRGIGERTSASIPLYPSVPSGTPNRPSAGVEQSKTLKCSECGAQNYPTEWYCERCGAELAAL